MGLAGWNGIRRDPVYPLRTRIAPCKRGHNVRARRAGLSRLIVHVQRVHS